MNGILDLTPSGLYCRKGDFYIDPWRPVKHALITHAHADHARGDSQSYLCAQDSKALLQARLGHELNTKTLKYDDVLSVNSARISLNPVVAISGKDHLRETLPCFHSAPGLHYCRHLAVSPEFR